MGRHKALATAGIGTLGRGSIGGKAVVSNPYHQPGPYGGQPQQPSAGVGYGYGHNQPYPQGHGAPQQPHGAYGAPVPRAPVPVPPPPVRAGEQTNLAMISVVFGFISIVGFWLYAGVLAPLGIGFGVAALRRSRRTGVGRNAAIGGILLSVLGLLVSTTIVVALIATAGSD